jgi:RNA-directed DNA polymerase
MSRVDACGLESGAVNETKTRVCCLPEEKFDFPGYTLGRYYSAKTGRAYLGSAPSKKRAQRLCQAVSGRHSTQTDVATLVETLNRKLIGWSNYFCCGSVSNAYRAVDRRTVRRLRQWLCIKHKVQGRGTQQFSEDVHVLEV